jgi:hypothetical protein
MRDQNLGAEARCWTIGLLNARAAFSRPCEENISNPQFPHFLESVLQAIVLCEINGSISAMKKTPGMHISIV